MASYQKILVAVDLLAEPGKVLRRASDFAGSGAGIYLLNIAFDPSYFASYVRAITMLNETENSVQQEQESWATNNINALIAEYGLEEAKLLVESGKPAEVILDKAKELGADLIIVGSHGQSGFNALLGSTTAAVLHHAACDVLTISTGEPD